MRVEDTGIFGFAAGFIFLWLVASIFSIVILFIFPSDQFFHLHQIGFSPHVVAVQHGFVFKPWISIPLFLCFLWIGTTGGMILQFVAQVAREDHDQVTKKKYPDGTPERDKASTAERVIPVVRIGGLFMVVVMPLIVVLPYGNGFAAFLCFIAALVGGLTLVTPLPILLLNWRFMLSTLAMVKGKSDARQFFTMHATEETPDMSGDYKKARELRGEIIPADQPERTHQQRSQEYTTQPTDQPVSARRQSEPVGMFGSVFRRVTKRFETAEIEADTTNWKARADNLKAKGDAMAQGIETTRLHHRAEKDLDDILATDSDEVKLKRAETARRLREEEERGKPTPPAPEPPQSTVDPASKLAEELSARYAPSLAQEMRNAVEREIMKMLGGMPESHATEPLKKRFEAMRRRVEQDIKDTGFE